MTSPFEKYRSILLDEDYSTATSLQTFVLSLYNGASTQFRADTLRNYDAKHTAIFIEFVESYNRHGENDEAFMQVCRDMWAQRKQMGADHLARVAAHEAISPQDYDEGVSEWHSERRWLEERTEAFRAKGWI